MILNLQVWIFLQKMESSICIFFMVFTSKGQSYMIKVKFIKPIIMSDLALWQLLLYNSRKLLPLIKWLGLVWSLNNILFLARFSDLKNKIKSWKIPFFGDNFGNFKLFGVQFFFFWSEINEKLISGVGFGGFYTKPGEKWESYFCCKNELTG